MKKQIMLGMTSLLCAGMAMTGNVAAAGDKSIPVTYDNRNSITDPDNPNLPTWGVSIPTSIAFSDTTKTQPVDVELITLNGTALTDLTNTFTVTVTAKSANGMKLKSLPGDTGLSYGVAYGSANVIGTTDVTIATLQNGVTTAGSNKQAGTATLGNDKATKLATYSDTVTYTISKTAV